MIGIDRNTGAAVDDWLQFVQRATRALTTPRGHSPEAPVVRLADPPNCSGRTSATTS